MKTEYTVVFEEEIDGGYSVWVPDLPGCASQGETLEEAMANIKEAMELYLEDSPEVARNEEPEFKRQFVMPIQIVAHG